MSEYSNLNPASLSAQVAKPRMITSAVISAGIHVLLLLLLSIGFLIDCFKYGTTKPAVAIKAEQKAAEEAEKERLEALAREEAIKKNLEKEKQQKAFEAQQKEEEAKRKAAEEAQARAEAQDNAPKSSAKGTAAAPAEESGDLMSDGLSF